MKTDYSAPRILIVGAGITGLTAAAQLAAAGRKCLLIESAEKVGGLCRTYELDDIRFDFGPHLFFYNPHSATDRFMLEVLKDEKVVFNRFRWAIHAKGRYWLMPVNIPDILFHYPLRYKWQIVQSLLRKRKAVTARGDSVRDMLEERMGPDFFADVFGPFTQKKTLVSPDKLHRDWSIRVERDVHNRKIVSSGYEKTITLRDKLRATFFPRYYYPLKGIEAIATGLWSRYREAGGETILECGPITFEKAGNRISRVQVGGEFIPVSSVVWTPSINALNRVLGGSEPAIQFVDLMIVMMTFNRRHAVPRPFAYTYHPDPQLLFNRLYYPDNLFQEQIIPDKEGLCVEINMTPELKTLSDPEIVDRVVNGIESLGLYRKQDLRESRVERLEDAMPVYELNYEAERERAFKTVHEYANLYAIGRSGGYLFCLTPAAVRQGQQMADELIGQATDERDKDDV